MTDEERKQKILDVLGAHESVSASELERMDVGGFRCRALIEELCTEGHAIRGDVDAQGNSRFQLEK
jgi:DeoR/GlpR family transcriptional regulator of sugar metabolism